MHRRNLIAVLTASLLLLLMAWLLFSGYAISHKSWPWLGMFSREIQAACRDSGTQWMVVACLLSYFVTFLILARRLAQSRGRSLDIWLFGFVALVLLRYAVDYTDAAKSLQIVVLLAGIVIGKGAALWVNASGRSTLQVASSKLAERSSIHYPRGSVVLVSLTVLLAASALWQPEMGMEFHYRGVRRWEGVWDNPNTYGLLMGVGLVLALGLLVASFSFQVAGESSGIMSRVTCHAPRFALLVATALCGFGLLKSYSRGAWLATAIVLVLLLLQVLKFQVSSGVPGRMAAMLRRNWFPLSILLLAILEPV